jgi:two-component system OmpR family sensor kinase
VSLRWRLALFGAGVIAAAVVVFSVLLYLLIAHAAETDADRALRDRAEQTARDLRSVDAAAAQPHGLLSAIDVTQGQEVFVEVLDANGRILESSGRLNGTAPAVPAELLLRAERGGAYATADASRGERLRLYAVTWRSSDQALHGYVVAGQPSRAVEASQASLAIFFVITGIPTLLAALAASWLVAGRALRPLKAVAASADEIGKTRDLAKRLPPRRRRDEIGLLTGSFNRMLEQLQDAYQRLAAALESQRRLVADASHELRTPLTTIRGNAGLLAHGPELEPEVREAAVRDIAGESERMSRLVDQLLTLARADAGVRLESAPLELDPLVGDVCRQATTVYQDRHWTAHLVRSAVAGDEQRLRQLLWILLDNAAKYTASGGQIQVHLWAEDGWARLAVADDGRGIPVEDEERVFERFYRVESSRSGRGAGLGLAIARWIVDQHGGRILARANAAGGASLYVDLPLLRTS